MPKSPKVVGPPALSITNPALLGYAPVTRQDKDKPLYDLLCFTDGRKAIATNHWWVPATRPPSSIGKNYLVQLPYIYNLVGSGMEVLPPPSAPLSVLAGPLFRKDKLGTDVLLTPLGVALFECRCRGQAKPAVNRGMGGDGNCGPRLLAIFRSFPQLLFACPPGVRWWRPVQRCCSLRLRGVSSRHRNSPAIFPEFSAFFLKFSAIFPGFSTTFRK